MFFDIDNKNKRFKRLVSDINRLVMSHKACGGDQSLTLKISKSNAILIEYWTGKPAQKQSFWSYPISIKEQGRPELEQCMAFKD